MSDILYIPTMPRHKNLGKNCTGSNIIDANFLVPKPKPCWSEIRVRRGPRIMLVGNLL